MKVSSLHKLPNGKTIHVDINKIGHSEWFHEFSTAEMPGKHTITIKISGNRINGDPLETTLNPLTLNVEDNSNIAKEDINDTITQNNTSVSWLAVTLKVGVFNIILVAIMFLLYKYSSIIRRKITPILFEETTDG